MTGLCSNQKHIPCKFCGRSLINIIDIAEVDIDDTEILYKIKINDFPTYGTFIFSHNPNLYAPVTDMNISYEKIIDL